MRLRHALGALLLLCTLGLALGLAGPAMAEADARSTAEIDHLIDLVRGSDCIFLRNGDPYPGPEAADHIVEKYDYYRDEIKTAEDFIDRAASRSVISGRAYQIACPGAATVNARDWLRAALEAYRRQHPPQSAP